jgi:hypothetical protein
MHLLLCTCTRDTHMTCITVLAQDWHQYMYCVYLWKQCLTSDSIVDVLWLHSTMCGWSLFSVPMDSCSANHGRLTVNYGYVALPTNLDSAPVVQAFVPQYRACCLTQYTTAGNETQLNGTNRRCLFAFAIRFCSVLQAYKRYERQRKRQHFFDRYCKYTCTCTCCSADVCLVDHKKPATISLHARVKVLQFSASVLPRQTACM